ncbi:hypothetical protein BS636_12695 [Acinetobacter sp. LoGeW2-3]|uniref:AAA family ATPase n=1 Tax=Acinetobacter sp. LoGeW2-3 TaxID=1808001 RepID=UPI000C05C75C|nr:AAA family ATPase [Acinetobacter sp. LoGeW2-3]ATO20464.1 hypothetical protein BS636_12695 [Acinetobacter sp. LoGeW2-3]
MLKNIEITNFGSYKNFKGLPEKNYFKKMNILYGANYSGKTTLSRIISIIKNKNHLSKYSAPKFKLEFENKIVLNEENFKENDKNLLIFNKDFINENLSFLLFNDNEVGSIKSFDAVVIGENLIEINGKIKDLNQSLEKINTVEESERSIQERINNEKKEIDNKKIELEKVINTSLTDKARELERMGLRKTARTYRRPDLEEDIKLIIQKNSSLIQTYSEDDITLKIKDMAVTRKPEIKIENKEQTIRNTFANFLRNVRDRLERVIEQTAYKEINAFFKDWINEGYKLHQHHNKEFCEFCGGKLQESLLQEYESYINNKDEIFRQEIKNLIDEKTKITKALQRIIDDLVDPEVYFYDSFKNEYCLKISMIKENIYELNKNFNLIEDQLKEKLDNIYEAIYFNLDNIERNIENFIKIYNEIVELCNKNDNFTINIDSEQSLIKLLVLEFYIIKYLIDFDCLTKQKELNKLKDSLESCMCIEQKIEDRLKQIEFLKLRINEEIEKLNAQISTQKAASDLVNKFLNSFFGHESLKLESLKEEENLGKFKIIRDGEEAYNLSEGECTLVAFCYFIAIVYNLKNINELFKYIIYIDDPISSLDSNNIFYIYSLIDTIICADSNYKQLFISTHNLEFFKYLRKLNKPFFQNTIKSCGDPSCSTTKKSKIEDVGFYHIRKNNFISEITELPNYLKKYNTEFNYLFSQIWNCAHSNDDLNPDQIYNISNNMRKFFEVYTYFKYPTDYKKSLFRENFFDAENNMNHFKLIDRIVNEYSHAEELFDRTMKPISSQEMIQAAKFVLERLKAVDKIQFEALVQSIEDLKEESLA